MIVAALTLHHDVDIFERCLSYHLSHGVSAVAVVLHQATAAARAAVARYRRYIPLVWETDQAAYRQDVWLADMRQRLVAELGLGDRDWIVHFDADEFWGNLEVLETVPATCLAARTLPWVSYAPHAADCHDLTQVSHCGLKFFLNYNDLPKVALRASAAATTTMGNHCALDLAGQELDRALVQKVPITIDHFPIRTLAQLRYKAAQARTALGFRTGDPGDDRCWHWDRWVRLDNRRNGLANWFAQLVPTPENVARRTRAFRAITEEERARLHAYAHQSLLA